MIVFTNYFMLMMIMMMMRNCRKNGIYKYCRETCDDSDIKETDKTDVGHSRHPNLTQRNEGYEHVV